MGELVQSAATVELKEGLGIEITVTAFPE